MFAAYAYIATMPPEALGHAIRRLRLQAGYTLRGFAEEIGISAAHQSDIEHGRRAPSEKVLLETAKKLASVGATYESLRALDSRLGADLEKWVQSTPEAGQMLREMRSSNRSPADVLRELKALLAKHPKTEHDK